MNRPTFTKSSVLLACVLLAGMAAFFAINAHTGILGTDEALYVFLAQGHVTATPLSAPSESLLSSVAVSLLRTGDPPGFFVLLHLWERISFDETWLRLLPFLFFVLSVGSLIWIARLFGLPPLASVALGALPLGSYYMNLYAIEIRGYGIEVFWAYLAIAFAALIILRHSQGRTSSNALWAALTVAVAGGLSSRFSFVITASALYLSLWYHFIVREKLHSVNGVTVRLFVSSAVSGGVFIVYFLLIFGRSFGIQFLPVDSAESVFTPGFSDYSMGGGPLALLVYIVKQFVFLPAALLGGAGVLRNIPLMAIIAILTTMLAGFVVVLLWTHRGQCKGADGSPLTVTLGFVFPSLLLVIALMLGIAGLHPFSILNRWGIFMQPALHTAVVALFAAALGDFGVAPDKIGIRLREITVSVLTILCVVYTVLFGINRLTIRGGGPHNTLGLVEEVVPRDRIPDVDGWYVSYGEVSVFKYHVLYGGLAGRVDGNRVWFESFPDSATIAREMAAFADGIAPGGTVVMITGHVDQNGQNGYRSAFERHFTVKEASGWDSWYAGEACLGIK